MLVQAGVRVSGAGASTVSQHLRPRLLERHAEPLALRRGVRRGDARGAARLLRQALGDAPSGGDALGLGGGGARALALGVLAMRVALELRRAHAQERATLRLLLGDARSLDRARGVPQLRGDPFLDRRVHRALARCDGVRARRDARGGGVVRRAPLARRQATPRRDRGHRGGSVERAVLADRGQRAPRARGDAAALPPLPERGGGGAPLPPRARARSLRLETGHRVGFARDESARRLGVRVGRRLPRIAGHPRVQRGGGVVRASAARPRAEIRCRAAGGSPCPAGNQWCGGSILSRRRRAENCLRLVQRGRRRDASSFGSRSRQNQK